MHQQQVVLAHDQRPGAQPSQQLVAVGRAQDVVQSVVAMNFAMARRHSEQMQVVRLGEFDACDRRYVFDQNPVVIDIG